MPDIALRAAGGRGPPCPLRGRAHPGGDRANGLLSPKQFHHGPVEREAATARLKINIMVTLYLEGLIFPSRPMKNTKVSLFVKKKTPDVIKS